MRGLANGERGDPGPRVHQNVRRGQYELAVDATRVFRLAAAFDELKPDIQL